METEWDVNVGRTMMYLMGKWETPTIPGKRESFNWFSPSLDSNWLQNEFPSNVYIRLCFAVNAAWTLYDIPSGAEL